MTTSRDHGRRGVPWLVASEALLNTARGLMTLALGLFLYRVTGGVWAFALTFSSELVFSMLVQGVAGATVDRLGPRRTLLGSSLASVLVFAGGLGLAADFDGDPSHAIGIALGLNLARPFLRTAVFAIAHQVVPPRGYERLNSYLSMALQIGQLSGMAMAGVLLESMTPHRVFLVIGVLYALVALLHLRLGHHLSGSEAGSGATGETRPRPASVLRHVRDNLHVLTICLIGAIDFALIALFNLALAPVVAARFAGQARWMTILDMSFAAGALVAGLHLSARKRPLGIRAEPTLCSIAAAFTTFAGFAGATPPWLIVPTIAVFGYFVTLSTVVWASGLQLATPAPMKGRLGSLRFISNSAFVALTTLAASYLSGMGGASVSAFAAMFALGALVWTSSLYGLSRRRLGALVAGA